MITVYFVICLRMEFGTQYVSYEILMSLHYKET